MGGLDLVKKKTGAWAGAGKGFGSFDDGAAGSFVFGNGTYGYNSNSNANGGGMFYDSAGAFDMDDDGQPNAKKRKYDVSARQVSLPS